MPLAYSSVACTEVHGTAIEDYSIEGGAQCSVTLKVAAADKDSLVADLLANQNAWPQLSAWTSPPRAYAATVTPHATNSPADGQVYIWDEYLVAVKYSTDPTRQLYSEELEPTAEFVRLDHRYFRWASGAPLSDGEAPGLLRKSLNLTRTYFQAAAVPAEVLTGIGKVHNANYTSTSLGLTFAAETLLFLPNPVQRQVSTAGSSGFNYAVKFAYKPETWNKFYRANTNSYESIYDLAGSVVKPYVPANLIALLS